MGMKTDNSTSENMTPAYDCMCSPMVSHFITCYNTQYSTIAAQYALVQHTLSWCQAVGCSHTPDTHHHASYLGVWGLGTGWGPHIYTTLLVFNLAQVSYLLRNHWVGQSGLVLCLNGQQWVGGKSVLGVVSLGFEDFGFTWGVMLETGNNTGIIIILQ